MAKMAKIRSGILTGVSTRVFGVLACFFTGVSTCVAKPFSWVIFGDDAVDVRFRRFRVCRVYVLFRSEQVTMSFANCIHREVTKSLGATFVPKTEKTFDRAGTGTSDRRSLHVNDSIIE